MKTGFSDQETIERVISRALGEEIRRLRDGKGLTREKLIEKMGCDIHVQTLATYEQGLRQCTVVRLVQICMALEVGPLDVLGLALQHAEVDLLKHGMYVDLRALIADKRPEMMLIRKWARRRLAADPTSETVRISGPVLQELAVLSDYDNEQRFVKELLDFSPLRALGEKST